MRRLDKERSMRRRQLKGLWARLKELHRMSVNLTRDDLLIKLGQAKAKWPGGWRLVEVEIDPKQAAFQYALDRKKLRQARRRGMAGAWRGRLRVCRSWPRPRSRA